MTSRCVLRRRLFGSLLWLLATRGLLLSCSVGITGVEKLVVAALFCKICILRSLFVAVAIVGHIAGRLVTLRVAPGARSRASTLAVEARLTVVVTLAWGLLLCGALGLNLLPGRGHRIAHLLLIRTILGVLLYLMLRIIGRLLRTYMLWEPFCSLVAVLHYLLGLVRLLSHRGVRVSTLLVGMGYALGLSLSLGQEWLYLVLSLCKSLESMVELNNVALEVLSFVDYRHVLELRKKSVCLTVRIIKILILYLEVV